MECTCDCNDKSNLHKYLYNLGVNENICRISSKNSNRVVSYICINCYAKIDDKISHITKNEGVCSNCIKDKKLKVDEFIHKNIEQEIYKLLKNTFYSKTEILTIIKEKFNDVSYNNLENIYTKIPIEIWLNRPIDFSKLLHQDNPKQCAECAKHLTKMKEGFTRIWRGQELCDSCWCNHDDEREQLWEEINDIMCLRSLNSECDNLRVSVCEICNVVREKKGVRFNFDHYNMFEKNKSISSMVIEGYSITDIKLELEKCQYICLSCHHIITEIENTLPFTQVKKNLTRNYNNKIITKKEYESECVKWNIIYEQKMKDVYIKMREYMKQKNLEVSIET
jgi:hypothetical protein